MRHDSWAGFKSMERWGQGTLIAGILVAMPWSAWASKHPAHVLGVEADPINNQVILKLSKPHQASLLSPLEKGRRMLIVDIQDSTLDQLPDKTACLRALQSQLDEVASVSLDAFKAADPLVRLVIQTRDPNVTAALQQNDDNSVILQLIKPLGHNRPSSPSPAASGLTPPQTAPPPPPEDPHTILVHSTPAVAATADPQSMKQLTGQTSVTVTQAPLDPDTVRETELLRKERNTLNTQVQRLTILVDQQHRMIGNIKALQADLVKGSYDRPQKQRITLLEQQLATMQKSNAEFKAAMAQSQQEVARLEARLKAAQTGHEGVEKRLSELQEIHLPDAATLRAGLLNTLADLTQAELAKLVEAEQAFRQGKKAEFENTPQVAETQYRKALANAPQVQEYALSLAGLYTTRKQYDKAQEVLQAALRYHPEDAGLFNEMGKVALLRKDEQTALTYFRKALPAGVLSNYASSLRRTQQLKDAELLYQLAISATPADSDLYFNLGNLYLAQKRYSEAQERYLEALRLNPDFAEAHFHLGLAYVSLGKVPQAIDELTRYLKQMPNAPNKDAVQDYLKDLTKISAVQASP